MALIYILMLLLLIMLAILFWAGSNLSNLEKFKPVQRGMGPNGVPLPEEVPNVPGVSDSEALQNSFDAIAQKYGREYAQDIERVVAQETGFRSGQWTKTGEPGMVAASTTYPYGWSTLAQWAETKGLQPDDFGLVHFIGSRTSDGTGRNYIVFPSAQHGLEFLAFFLDKTRNREVEKWRGLTPELYLPYREKLNRITLKYSV